ncbi:PREDICTED: transcription termination factor MTERF2, chloroplastic isoform X1 [Nelumbo nucifera]|uniref:Transcription termination factor MTERF2, chloroplastic isoform X1 n=1 Tax=Nelumbo nucifera TaxID=4432 RepID=A0A1U8ADT2_NELNU|nr:PREDICTED: transcription termination factor MTERF2, chloroplastic isoform X1 [Nelumbo nucifera]
MLAPSLPSLSKNLKISVPHEPVFLGNWNFPCNLQFPGSIYPSPSKTYLKFERFNYSLLFNRLSDTRQRASIVEHGGNSDDEELVLEAREAVAEVLQEGGVSKQESLDIVSNSPKYVKMLIDGVHDLDEHSLWKSWSAEGEDVESLSLKKKVFYMAKEKGDNGMLPFLESIGLNPMVSTHVARYLSSEKLPNLINKVKYMKEILFSSNDDEVVVGKNARRMMINLSISIDEDVQQTLSFFEKMEAKRGGLNMLDSKDVSFQYFVESFPRFLMLPVEYHLKLLVEFFQDIGVPKELTRVVILLFPPIIFYDIEKDIKPRIKAFEKVSIEGKDIGRMLLKYPWVISSSIIENYEEVLTFFDAEKVPRTNVSHAIKSWPHILGCSISKIRSMVEQFGEIGVKNKRLGKVIASSPQLLLRKHHEFLQVVSFMEELGFDGESIGRILSRCPEIFAASVDKTLKRKLKFLADIGISKDHLTRVIRKYPELLVSDIDKTLLPRMKYLMKTGLSKREVASMVRRFSPLLGYSVEEVLRPKLEFLVNTMEKPVKDVVEYPRYFSYSLDKKIKPRFWVLKGRNVECSLKDMLGKNDEDFAADYMGIGKMLVPPL